MSQPDANTRHWSALYRTDPAHTKGFTRSGGFKGTAIKPIYATQKMTEHFGPVGIGWGMTKPEFRVEGSLVFCTVGLWFMDGGTKSDIVWGMGGDSIASRRQGTEVPDDEAFKKAYTDALSNAMKYLGVGGDVHMGQFDDSKYRDEVSRQIAEEKGDASNTNSKPDPKTMAADMVKALNGAPDLEALDGCWDDMRADLKLLPREEQGRIGGTFDQNAARVFEAQFSTAADVPALTAAWKHAQGYMGPMAQALKDRLTVVKDDRKHALMNDPAFQRMAG